MIVKDEAFEDVNTTRSGPDPTVIVYETDDALPLSLPVNVVVVVPGDGDGDGVGDGVGDGDNDGDGVGDGDSDGDGDGDVVGVGAGATGSTASRKLLDAVFQRVAKYDPTDGLVVK